MSFKKLLIASAAVLLLAGCAQTTPLAIVVPSNPVLKGNINGTYGLIGGTGSFSVTNGSLTCSSNQLLGNGTPVVCNDGRKGAAYFDYEGRNGTQDHGQITFNDGTKADVFIGDAAKAY